MNKQFEARLAKENRNISVIVSERISDLLRPNKGIILFGAGGGGC